MVNRVGVFTAVATTICFCFLVKRGSFNSFVNQREKWDEVDDLFGKEGMPESATALDIQRFHQWNNLGACKTMKYFGGWYRQDNKTGLDNYVDGNKAVCLDENIRPDPDNCLVYSFGIRDDPSFDIAMAEYGCEVHSFDPTIDPPVQNQTKKFIFHELGLDGYNGIDTNGWEMRTLDTIIKQLGHTNRIIDVVKLDIELSEYAAITSILETGADKQIRQLAVEAHNLSMEKKDWKEYHYKFSVLWKLEKSSFRRYNSHGAMRADMMNNMAHMSDFFCYEMAWYNTELLR